MKGQTEILIHGPVREVLPCRKKQKAMSASSATVRSRNGTTTIRVLNSTLLRLAAYATIVATLILAAVVASRVIGTGDGSTRITTDGITTGMISAEAFCPIEYLHEVDGPLLATHEVQNLGGTGVTLTLPADLSAYKNKDYHIYSVADHTEHLIEIAEGGASWDKFNTYRFLRVPRPTGSGVSFHVIASDKLTVTGSNGALKCTGMEITTCVPAENGAYTYAVVTPPDGIPEGAFTWPAPNGSPQTHAPGARNIPPPGQPYYPTATLGGVFPPPDAVHFTSANAAIRALAGQTVYNTTIFFEPGVYPEAVIVDGFSASHSWSASVVSGGNDVATPGGLTLVGDPRAFAGATYVDCVSRVFSGVDYNIDNPGPGFDELYGASDINAIVANGASISLTRCDNLDDSLIPNKTLCDASAAVNFLYTGYGPSDKVLVYDHDNSDYHLLDVVDVSATSIVLNLTDSGISDLANIFAPAPTLDQCGSSITFLPNRVIESPVIENDFNELTSPAVLTLNVDVGLRGFWIKYKDPDTRQQTGAVLLVSASATIKNMVLDGRDIDASSLFGPTEHGVLQVMPSGFLSDGITSPASLNINVTGSDDFYSDLYPNTIVSTDDQLYNVLSYGKISLSQLVNLRGDLFLLGGETSIHRVLTLVDGRVIMRAQATAVYELINCFRAAIRVQDVARVSVASEAVFMNIDTVITMISPSAVASIDYMVIGDGVNEIVDANNGAGLVTIDSIDYASPLTGTEPYPGLYSGMRLFIGKAPIYGTQLHTSSGFINQRFGTHAITNNAVTALSFGCSSIDELNNRVFRVYSETDNAHTLTLVGCPTAFAGLGVPATFGGSAGDGITFVFVDGRVIIEHSTNMT